MAIIEVLTPMLPLALVGGVIYLAFQRHKGDRKPTAAPGSAMHCMTCGEDSRSPAAASAAKRGNTTLEIALWLFLLWPIAIVYSVWRRIGKGAKSTCPVCDATTLVPSSTPAARAHRRQLGTAVE